MGKPKIPPMWLVLAGAILEIIGVVLLSRISTGHGIDGAQYGYQIIAGFGTGMINAGLIILVPYIMEKRDLGKEALLGNGGFPLTLHSCRVRSKLAIPHSRRSSRHRYRRVRLNALHSLPSYQHRVARNGASTAGENRGNRIVETG